MIYLHLVHLAATVGFCTLLWVVQLIIYPQMAKVRAEDFSAHHKRHTQSISWIVAPLFILEGISAAAVFCYHWQVDLWFQVTSLGLFMANSLLTFRWFVPMHTQLAQGKNDSYLSRLIAMNRWRTLLSTARVVLVFSLISRVIV